MPRPPAAQAAELAPTAAVPRPPPGQPFTAQPAPVSSLLRPQLPSGYQQPTIRGIEPAPVPPRLRLSDQQLAAAQADIHAPLAVVAGEPLLQLAVACSLR